MPGPRPRPPRRTARAPPAAQDIRPTRRGPLGGLQLRARPGRAALATAPRWPARAGTRPRPRRRDRRLPGACCASPSAARPRGSAAEDRRHRHRRAAPPAPVTGSHRGGRHSARKYTGRLTGFARTHPYRFQPTSGHRCIPWPKRPLNPRSTCKERACGAPRAPYADGPLRRGALPCTAHECNAS